MENENNLFYIKDIVSINRENLPYLGKYYISLHEGDKGVVARVYGNTEEEVEKRADLLTKNGGIPLNKFISGLVEAVLSNPFQQPSSDFLRGIICDHKGQ